MKDNVNEALMGRDLFGEVVKPDIKGILKNKFLIPLFSVLSARDGDWQTRKRQWLQLGIQSEVGRELSNTSLAIDHDDPKYAYCSNRGSAEGGSVFDPTLTELMYSWFCPDGGQILDPFCGGSVRGIVASIMGYKYWRCDLRQEQIDANYAQISLCSDNKPDWVVGDALDVVKSAPPSDFIFTCPPYGDLEVYSDNPKDISTMEFPRFITTLKEIVKLSCGKLKNNSFACIVVGDYRDKQGFYRCFPQHTTRAFLDAGLKLYNEIILVTSVGSLPIRITKQFESGRKIGKTHQNVLVFCKGTPPRFNKEA